MTDINISQDATRNQTDSLNKESAKPSSVSRSLIKGDRERSRGRGLKAMETIGNFFIFYFLFYFIKRPPLKT